MPLACLTCRLACKKASSRHLLALIRCQISSNASRRFDLPAGMQKGFIASFACFDSLPISSNASRLFDLPAGNAKDFPRVVLHASPAFARQRPAGDEKNAGKVSPADRLPSNTGESPCYRHLVQRLSRRFADHKKYCTSRERRSSMAINW